MKGAQILRPGDLEYDRHMDGAIREPLLDAVSTRIRFTPPAEIDRLIEGLGDEVKRRLEEVTP